MPEVLLTVRQCADLLRRLHEAGWLPHRSHVTDTAIRRMIARGDEGRVGIRADRSSGVVLVPFRELVRAGLVPPAVCRRVSGASGEEVLAGLEAILQDVGAQDVEP